MLKNKLVLVSLLLLIISNAYAAATPTSSQPAPVNQKQPAPTQPTLILEISAPNPLANLAKGYQPNPVYLQYTPNDGNPPAYSDPLVPGQTKPIEMKITSPSKNGSQFQIVSGTSGEIQPMSFIYAFTEQRLDCLINKNVKITVTYNINNRMMEVEGVPVDC